MRPKKTSGPLSDVPEEAIFCRADEACHRLAKRLVPHIRKRFEAARDSIHRPSMTLAVMHGDVGAATMAFEPRSHALAWSSSMHPVVQPVRKAGPPSLSPEDARFMDEAVDVGIETGIDLLPPEIRADVDEAAARELTRQRLLQGSFRRIMGQLEEAQRGLNVLIGSSTSPELYILRDVERLILTFGLTRLQAMRIVKETTIMVEARRRFNGKTYFLHKKDELAIRRAIERQVRIALEASYETMAQSLVREAIATAQQALYDTARRQGLFGMETQKEWVTRHDEKVCPRCDAFDAKRAPVNGMFISSTGEEAYQPGIHPRCRCSTRLVSVKSEARIPRPRPIPSTTPRFTPRVRVQAIR